MLRTVLVLLSVTRFGHQASAHGYRENRSQISGQSPDWRVAFAGAQKWSIQNTRDDDWPFSDEVRPGAEQQSEVDRRYGDHEISAARCVRCVHEP